MRWGWLAASALALAPAALLWLIAEPSFLDTDAAQYLSTAVNVAAGDGLATDIVYYDQHYAAGTVPAPQTVFPPGLPLLLALMIAVGADPLLASLTVGTLAMCVTGLLIYGFLIRVHAGPLLALIGTVTWFALGLAWVNVLEGRAEVPFALATLGAVITAATARRRTLWLLGAGVLCSVAILLRYQGVFLLAAMAIWSLAGLLRPRGHVAAMTVRTAFALLTVPAVTVAVLVLRNLALAASPAGGPVDTVSSGVSFPEVMLHLYWAVSDVASLSLDGLAAARPAEWLVLAGATLIVGASLYVRWRRAQLSGPSLPADTVAARRSVAELCVLYAGVTVAALLYLGTTRADAYLQGRFLVPLAPALVLVWVLALDYGLRRTPRLGSMLLVSGIGALHAGLWSAQLGGFITTLDEWRGDRRLEVIEQALSADYVGAPLRRHLERAVSRSSPLFAEPAQPVWLLLHRPLLGATPAGFSSRIWDGNAVQRLGACYGARLILFLPKLFDADRPQHANKTIFIDLAAGRVPPYLRLIHKSAFAELYEMDGDAAGDSCPQPRGPA